MDAMPYKSRDEQRAYQREWISRRRREFFADKQCVDCGSSENLELDHVDRVNKVDHKIWSWSSERRAAEIAKCVVRCESCHLTKTIAETYSTHCSAGHEYDVVGRDKSPGQWGRGQCSECRRIRQRNRRRK